MPITDPPPPMASTHRTRKSSTLLTPTINTKPSRSRISPSSLSLPLEPSPDFFPTSKAEILRLVSVISIATFIAVVCNYIAAVVNQQPKPFCTSNSELEGALSDFCEPCPSNGVCYDGKLECAHGYQKHGDSCIEDSKVSQAAKELYKFVEDHVCKEYAQHMCGGTGAIWVQEDGVLNKFGETMMMNYYGLSDVAYGHAKQRAIEAVGELLERRTDHHGIKEVKCPDQLAQKHMPLSCLVQQWIVENTIAILAACALLVGCFVILLRVRRRHYLSLRAEELYNEVCDVVEEKALLSRSTNYESEPWVIASWLRDYLLSPTERKDPILWKKVEELVREDSRLEQYPKVVKGESKVVWEWQVEGSLSSSGKKRAHNRRKPESSHNQRKPESGEGMDLSSRGKNWVPKAVATALHN
ncbi:unnamed protein product [Cuscuta epithymum]|uniref:Man1/Src1-like C-terminal domain-containing protein n=1 Tax=Cuscuta epithymum TaxID=186058 RepID=A0AAV0CPJ7_9ASTE|nr:unnamed protein product [Cuscuta epithymum]